MNQSARRLCVTLTLAFAVVASAAVAQVIVDDSDAPPPEPTAAPAPPASTQPVDENAVTQLRWASQSGPAEFLLSWTLALQRGHLREAASMVHGVPGTPEGKRELYERLDFWGAAKEESGVSLLPLGWLVEGDAAVMVMAERTGTATTGGGYWYLHRVDGGWRILADPNTYERPAYGFTDEQVAEYERVEKRVFDLMNPPAEPPVVRPAATQPARPEPTE